MEKRFDLVLTVLALAAAGCASSSTETPQPQAAHGAAVLTQGGQVASVPYAPAGTIFEVSLDQPVDTRLSRPGERVSATLLQPISASDGSVLVPAGTKLDGRIASIDFIHGPHVALEFDALRLQGSDVPVGIRVLSAQQNTYKTMPTGAGVTSMQGGEQPQATEQLSMPRGAAVQLVLTRPIVQGKNLK